MFCFYFGLFLNK